jgi:hypothetical protein
MLAVCSRQQPACDVTSNRAGGLPVRIFAYLYLPRRAKDRSVRTRRAAPGLVIDFTSGGRAIGIRITAPSKVTITALNRVLRSLGAPPLKRADLAPLRAA